MFLSYVANKFLTLLTNILYGTKLTDMETCYKAIRKEFVKDMNIKSNKFDLEPEITAKLVKKVQKLKSCQLNIMQEAIRKVRKLLIKTGLWQLGRFLLQIF